MSKLSNEEYTVKKDRLVYDSYRLIDSTAVSVQVPEGGGVLKRGQIIDFDAETETYKPHEKGGTANRIVTTDTPYLDGDTDIVVPTYISGDFRASECVSAEKLTLADKENLRKSGIVLK